MTFLHRIIQHIQYTVLLLLGMFCISNSAYAITYNVTNTTDGMATNQLRGAILAADAAGGGPHVINVPAGTYNLTMGTIHFGNNAQNISIIGAGLGQTIISMTNTNRDRIFFINPTAEIADVSTSISGITFTNGYVTSDYYGGGAILCGGPGNVITITNCAFEGNTDPMGGDGGAISYASTGIINIDQCSFINNTAYNYSGGGYFVGSGGAVSIAYYTYANATAPVTGSTSITNCSFTGNSSFEQGGAIYIYAEKKDYATSFNTVIQNNIFTGNSLAGWSTYPGNGGAIFIGTDFPTAVNYNYFSNNTVAAGTVKNALYITEGYSYYLGNGGGATVDATNNWWGCNTDPQASGTCSEVATVVSGSFVPPTTLITQPQLVLKTTASTNTLCTANGTTVTASVLQNSAGTTMSLANVSRLIGMPLTFSAANGTISNAQATIQANGTATATYTAATTGNGTVKALAGYMTSGNTTQVANITVNASPVITAQPVNVASCSSGSVSMSVTATGGALTYQWYKGSTPLTNNSVISGATSATLTFTNPDASYNATDYKVTVSNSCGNITSSDASLILYNNVNRLYVATGGTGNGSSWGSAMGNLHTALSAAAGCNSITEIFVAAGTYNVGANSFIMRNNLAIYGGFDPLNGITDLTHNRIMPNASNGQGSILNGQNVRPVIWNVFTSATAIDNTAVLDGFTITGGSYSNGAGIRNEYASPTLRNLVIRGNIASVSGAGIYNSASNPVISNSVISGNHVLNAASDVSGAGITNANFSTPTIINATITGNSLTSALGTIRGAGICNQGFSVPVVYNSIIWNNLKNNNPTLAGADIENNGGNITLKNSITQGYTTGNTADNNLANTDPLFVGTDFQLSNTSPAINAGSNTFYPGLSAATKDLAGNPRLAGLVIDMGANENQSVITPDANLTVYVREGFAGNGSSWANATSNLQGAINSGATKVFVAVGSYSVPLPNSFRLKTGVAVYGGFDPVNGITDLTHNRILPNRGMGDGSVLTANNAGRVMENISCDNTAVLDGFTITGGYAETWSAGIYNHHNASPTLTNLVIKGNTSYYVGNSTSYGGGIACWVQSSPIISNVIIKGNSAKIGAGVFVQGYSHPVITNTLITDNHVSTGGTGGGIALDNVDVSTTLHNVTIAGNTGGVADALAINNTNTMDIKNSIVFGSILTVGSGTYTAQYSFIEGNSSTANGNIDATSITVNDIFTNPAAGDYSLRGAAFVVNKGNNTLFTGLSAATKDLAGNARLNGTDIDLGAYEFFIQPGANSIAYVKPAATGLGNGSSWADATGLLQLAIDGTNVQKVYVATGNYPVGNHSFIMKNNVEIYGGFNPANNTTDWDTRTLPNKGLGDGSVLDGQNVRPVIWNYNNGLNTTAILDGFTLTNGTGSNGGAMYNYNTAPAFNNLVIRNNSATRGGGIYNQTASITLNNAVIKDNTASNDGGGMYNVTNSSPVLTNVAFTGNTANNGGGMFSVTNSSPVVTNALFANNAAVNTGGAIINLTIAPLQLTNVTIGNNIGTDPVYSIGTGSITFHNSIVFGTVSGPYTAQYSLVQGSSATSNGNIDATGVTLTDIFTNPATGDYTLSQTSPVIDVGNNALNSTATDLAGNARIYNNAIIDLGAYEFHCASTIDFNNVVFTDSIITYDGNPHSIIAQNVPLGAAVTYEITDTNNQTISGNTATEAGIYIITATISDITTSCNTVIRTASLTINKAQSVITTNSTQTYLYDGTVKNVVATLNHNEAALVYTPQQGYADIGTYSITVSVIETANYLAASENVNLVIDNATITGITFSNGTFTYDGTAHSIFASGVPAGATVAYTGNGQTNAGTYTVDALVQMPNYNDLQLSATMTIDNATITGVTFNNGTFTYDGTAHSIFASGAPAGAPVTYTITDSQNNTQPGNSAVNVGVYTVTAIISMANYENLELQAILTIDTYLGVSEPDEEKDIFVYPNPFTDIIKVSKIENVKAIYVFDMSGRLIKRLAPSTELNLSNLSQQSYLLVLVMENGYRKPFKIIKK